MRLGYWDQWQRATYYICAPSGLAQPGSTFRLWAGWSLRIAGKGPRGVAQPGSALAWGASGRWFESSHPDRSRGRLIGDDPSTGRGDWIGPATIVPGGMRCRAA